MVKNSSRTSRAFAGIVTGLFQYGFVVILQFILAPVILQVAGKEVLGAYSVIVQAISWAALTDLGFGVALGRNLAQSVAIEDQGERFQKIFTTGRTFYIASNLACAGLILILRWKLTAVLNIHGGLADEAKDALGLLSIWIIIRTPLALYNDALIATQNLAPVNIIMAIGVAVRLLLSIGLVYYGGSLIGLMLANIIGEAVTYILGYIWFKKLFPHYKFGWGIPDRALFREMLVFGVTYMAVILAGRLSANTDSIIVGSLYGVSAVAIYYTTQVPGTMLYQLIWKVTDSSAPAINELQGRQDTDRLAKIYIRLLRYSLLLVLPFAIGLIAFNRGAVILWVGADQYAGDIFTIGLAFFAITQVIIHLNCIIMVAYGDIRIMSLVMISTGIIKVGLAFWLGRMFGLAGIMLSNSITDIFCFLYFNHRVWRMFNLSIKEIWISALFPAFKPSFVLLCLLMLVLHGPQPVTWFIFLAWVAVFTIIWAVSTISVGLMSWEREQVKAFIQQKINFNLGR